MKNINILLVEDNEGDIILTTETLYEAKITNKISVARDGAQALELLSELAKENPEELPNLVLLDINLPKVDGMEVLQSIKNDSVLKDIAVVMLTTSSSPIDIDEAIFERATSFITKPLNIKKFFEVVVNIEEIGLSMVLLPSKKSNA